MSYIRPKSLRKIMIDLQRRILYSDFQVTTKRVPVVVIAKHKHSLDGPNRTLTLKTA